MSGTGEDEQYNSDYSYEESAGGFAEDDVASDAGALNVGDIQEANEASDEESLEEQEEDDGNNNPLPRLEYEPSYNRGPGGMDAEEAGIVRNQVSNLQTSIKKRQVKEVIAVSVANKQNKMMKLVCGNGLSNAGYVHTRNIYTPKGCPFGPKGDQIRKAIYEKEEVDAKEAFAVEVAPKFKVATSAKDQGKNNSPAVEMDKCILAGFKGELQNMCILPNRAQNMALRGVKFVRDMKEKLQRCKPAGQNVTEEELLAACQLSLYVAFTGNLDENHPDDFNPVNNDIHYDHLKELKKKRRWED